LRYLAQYPGDHPAERRSAEIIEYLKTPPSRARLIELIEAMAIPVRALLREKGTPYTELGLADPNGAMRN